MACILDWMWQWQVTIPSPPLRCAASNAGYVKPEPPRDPYETDAQRKARAARAAFRAFLAFLTAKWTRTEPFRRRRFPRFPRPLVPKHGTVRNALFRGLAWPHHLFVA